jgi:hypothetical protein
VRRRWISSTLATGSLYKAMNYGDHKGVSSASIT